MPKTLVLRCNSPANTSRNGFQWPGVGGYVEAPDWAETKECGNGLHGWLYGVGDASTSDYAGKPYSLWVVVEVESAGVIDLGGKVKFKGGVVVFLGDRLGATSYLTANEPKSVGAAVTGASVVVGDKGTATAGEKGCCKLNGGTKNPGAIGLKPDTWVKTESNRVSHTSSITSKILRL